MMVEIPAVVEIIDDFAKAADFFSIGTNDLVQYMLAVDRNNEEVADYYLPQHPSVLRAIKKVAQAAVSAGIDVSVCGDMANQSKYIPFLLGVGIRKLSMNPSYLYQNQKIVTSLSMAEAANLADKVLKLSKIKEVENMLA
jgi:phosphotransferase system enzyme I (PtsP)